MGRRLTLGLALSVLAHVGAVVVGLAMGARGLGGPVDVDLADVHIEEVKDFPLGGPPGGDDKPQARPRAKARAPESKADGTLASRASKDEPKPGAPAGNDDVGPAPTSDLGAYGPEGSRVTVLMRLDRLRGTDYQTPVDELLLHLPDRRDLLAGTGLDLFRDFDVLLAATPNPRDPLVTFLAVRHHLAESALKSALGRGAKETDRALVWRRESGRLVGERRARKAAVAGAPPNRDDRLIVLSDPGLAIVTPPAYRDLLVGAGPRAATATTTPDGGAPPDGGGASGAAIAAAAAGGWATLLWRIDAEQGLMPEDGTVMVKAVDMFKSRAATPDGIPVLFGMEVPPSVSGIIGIDDAPYLDLTADFKTEAPAKHWETQWPVLQRKWRSHPYVVLSGFSTLVGRATLTREGASVRVHLSVTRDETLRLLTLALQVLVGRGM
jgi:hypothetical protein